MAEPPPDPDASTGPERGTTPTPRWVKVFGLVALLVLLLVVILLLAGGGDHGPGRHAAPGTVRSLAPVLAVALVAVPPSW